MAVRVLLVDDDARLFELLRGFLAPNDVVLEHARSGATGLDALDRETYDAVLLDVMMPGIDGLETLRRIRARTQIPVIMLTARGDEADRVVGLEMGADDYIAKPFSSRELLARLRAVLRRLHPEVAAARLSEAGVSPRRSPPRIRSAPATSRPVRERGSRTEETSPRPTPSTR